MNYRALSLSVTETLLRSESGVERPSAHADRPAGPPPFSITISREVGALGSTVAAEVGRQLDWPVYDRNILEKIAEELRRPPDAVESVDERPASWLTECLSGLFAKYSIGSDLYVKHLFAAVRGLGVAGRCVIVGRGANFLLSPKTTLRVRLVASPKDRARVIADRFALAPPAAEARMQLVERERFDFIKRTFKEDPADPHHYDVVLNMSRLTPEGASALIIDALRRMEAREAAVVSVAKAIAGGKP